MILLINVCTSQICIYIIYQRYLQDAQDFIFRWLVSFEKMPMVIKVNDSRGPMSLLKKEKENKRNDLLIENVKLDF